MARLPNPFDGIIQAQQDRVRAQDRWREVVGIQPAPAAPPRFIDLDDVPVNRAPPIQEELPWNIRHNDVVRNIEAQGWWDMQQAMMVDIEAAPPPPDPGFRAFDIIGGRVVPRPIRIAEVDDMQGKKYGEDYS